jgi:DNA polymerase III subunit epsilon
MVTARACWHYGDVPLTCLGDSECRIVVVEARPWLESVAGRYPYEYALVDVETTGLNPAQDRIIQVAVAHVSAHGVLQRTWSTLIDPDRDPGPTEIHGLTREHLAKAPRYPSVVAELGNLLSNRVLVAHNAKFDWQFLAAESRRAARELPVTRRLCTIDLTRQLDLPVTSLSLGSVASYYGIPQARAHDAIDDMRVMSEVLLKLLTAAEQVELALPLIGCDPADARGAYPVRSPRQVCGWEYPGRWTRGERLVRGMKVAITGETAALREVLAERASDSGLDVMNGVSGRTSLLVANGPELDSDKARSAARHGVPIVDELAFIALLADIAPGVPRPAAVEAMPAAAAVAEAVPVPAARRPRRLVDGPLSGRCLLVLGGLHQEAADLRARIGSLGGIAAVNLTPRVTGVVPLAGAEKERRWTRITALGVPICDPETFEPVTAAPVPSGPVFDEPAPARADVVLPRGGVVDLPDEVRHWSVSIGWPRMTSAAVEVDVVAFLTDQDDEVRADSDFVFYNAPAAASGAVELTLDLANEALVDIRLDQVPLDVERITLGASIPAGHTFASVGPIQLVVRTGAGAPHIRATLDAATTEQSLILGTFYRRAGRWRFRAVGQGHEYGLAELATSFGVDIDS